MRVVIAGAGESGRFLAALLSEAGTDVVLLDRSAAALAAAEERLDVMCLQGDATHRAVLRRAEVGRAHGFFAFTESGPANLVAAALARAVGTRVTGARVDDPAFYESEAGVERDVLGTDYVLCATRLAAAELSRQLASLDVPFVEDFATGAVRVALLPVVERSPSAGARPSDLDAGDDAHIAAVLRDGDLRPPQEVPTLEPDDALLIACSADRLFPVRARLTAQTAGGRVVLVGAGDTGAQLARRLAARGVRVDLVDADAAVCERVAAELPECTVLCGDGRSVGFLSDLQADSARALVACTGEDEVNLMVSLLARQIGVAHAFIEVHRPGYADLYEQLGVTGTAGTYEVLARAGAEALAARRLVRSTSVPGSTHLLVEVRLPGTWEPDQGSPARLADLPLPTECLTVGVARGSSFLRPEPSLRLERADRVVVAQPRRRLSRLDAALGRLSRGRQA